MDKDTDGRVDRRSVPTRSFSAPQPVWDWLAAEAARAGISQSELVRRLIDAERMRVGGYREQTTV